MNEQTEIQKIVNKKMRIFYYYNVSLNKWNAIDVNFIDHEMSYK